MKHIYDRWSILNVVREKQKSVLNKMDGELIKKVKWENLNNVENVDIKRTQL